jgi:hypothetical protein
MKRPFVLVALCTVIAAPAFAQRIPNAHQRPPPCSRLAAATVDRSASYQRNLPAQQQRQPGLPVGRLLVETTPTKARSGVTVRQQRPRYAARACDVPRLRAPADLRKNELTATISRKNFKGLDGILERRQRDEDDHQAHHVNRSGDDWNRLDCRTLKRLRAGSSQPARARARCPELQAARRIGGRRQSRSSAIRTTMVLWWRVMLARRQSEKSLLRAQRQHQPGFSIGRFEVVNTPSSAPGVTVCCPT